MISMGGSFAAVTVRFLGPLSLAMKEAHIIVA
jgi:hypothetical protein